MAISTKTRKMLWARSGNKCAFCRIELITSEINLQQATIIGEECHIISKTNNGPRGNSEVNFNHDEFDNLILLCSKHHKIIDENENEYTVEKLIEIKSKHEAWVSESLKEKKKYSPFILPRITSGQELSKVLSRVHFYSFFNEDFDNDKEARLIASFFQSLQDWGDILPDLGIGEIINAGQSLQKELDELKESGFLFFGEVSKKKIRDLGIYDVATFSICKETSLNVIKWDEILNGLKKTDA
jgi:hypothetical protein